MGDTGNSGKAFSHFWIEPKKYAGGRFSSFTKFKQSENWKSPKTGREGYWVRPLLRMVVRLVTDATSQVKKKLRASGHSCPDIHALCGYRLASRGR